MNAFGPYDYRDPANADELLVVETHHLTDAMYRTATSGAKWSGEGGDSGGNVGTIAAHLDYTLRAFPNHPRALFAMAVHLAHLRESSSLEYQSTAQRFRTAECYFDRARTFRSNDPAVHAAEGIYLQRAGQHERALASLQTALELAPGNPEVEYSIGMAYLRLGDLARSRNHAEVAYRLGYPLPYLRKELTRRGYPLRTPN